MKSSVGTTVKELRRFAVWLCDEDIVGIEVGSITVYTVEFLKKLVNLSLINNCRF